MPRMTDDSVAGFSIAVAARATTPGDLADARPQSSALHVPEDGIAGDDPAQARLMGGRDEILAERDVGHVLEGLPLHLAGDLLLGREIGRLQPLRAQLLELGRGRPADGRILAVAAQE